MKLFGKIVGLVIGTMLIASMVIAQPVYIETDSYQVEVTELGHVQVRKATRVFKDGKEISKTYHRHVLSPGENLDNEVDKVKAVADAVWTDEVIFDYNKMVKEREKKFKGGTL